MGPSCAGAARGSGETHEPAARWCGAEHVVVIEIAHDVEDEGAATDAVQQLRSTKTDDLTTVIEKQRPTVAKAETVHNARQVPQVDRRSHLRRTTRSVDAHLRLE